MTLRGTSTKVEEDLERSRRVWVKEEEDWDQKQNGLMPQKKIWPTSNLAEIPACTAHLGPTIFPTEGADQPHFMIAAPSLLVSHKKITCSLKGISPNVQYFS